MKKPVFKQNHQHQLLLFPPNLGSMITEHHPVRVVDKIVDKLDIEELLSTYKGGGSSSYHPRMLLKVLIYSYLRNIYSSRKIEEALQENIHFMWLSGMARPDHSTINDFRSKRLKDMIKDVFTQVVLLLAEEGMVDIKDIYTDGTKLEANANRYTFVWGKAIATNKEKMKEKLSALWSYVEELYKEEEKKPEKPDFSEISAEKVEATIEKINEALTGKEVNKEVKKKLKYAEKNYPEKLREYAEKEAILNGRNSYSKTDKDATFMRMKEDHMKNGQLKPGYNAQFSTSNQVVVYYSLGQTTADTSLMKDHLNGYKIAYGFSPNEVTADAGYGSEENYEYLAEQNIEAYVKYGYFHKEQKKSFQDKIAEKENLYYNAELDFYVCPMGQRMEKIGTARKKTTSGFVQVTSLYQAKNCEGCPLRKICHKAAGNRIISKNHNLDRHKQKARTLLKSEKGIEKRGQRCVDVEATFGQLKQNKGFRRFYLRGLEKVNIELGLLTTSMNIAKLAKYLASKDEVCPKPSNFSSTTEKNEDLAENRA